MADYLKSLDIAHSFFRSYVPYDNSVMELFFSSMKRGTIPNKIQIGKEIS